VVQEILAGNSSEVSGQGEGAHDPAVPVDDRTRHSDAFVHQALDRRLRLVDVRVRRHQDAGDGDDRKRHLRKKDGNLFSKDSLKMTRLVVAF
jgi:hypothetical protein